LSDNGWDVVLIIFLLLLLAYLSQGCASLPAHWCKPARVEAVMVGEPKIRVCKEPVCEATAGEWIVDDSWMVEQAALMEDLMRKCEEDR